MLFLFIWQLRQQYKIYLISWYLILYRTILRFDLFKWARHRSIQRVLFLYIHIFKMICWSSTFLTEQPIWDAHNLAFGLEYSKMKKKYTFSRTHFEGASKINNSCYYILDGNYCNTCLCFFHCIFVWNDMNYLSWKKYDGKISMFLWITFYRYTKTSELSV